MLFLIAGILILIMMLVMKKVLKRVGSKVGSKVENKVGLKKHRMIEGISLSQFINV